MGSPVILRKRLHGELDAAVGVGGVHLRVAQARHVPAQVARQRQHGDGVRLRIQAHQDLRVRPAWVAGAGVVDAQQQNIHGLVRQRVLQHSLRPGYGRTLLGGAGAAHLPHVGAGPAECHTRRRKQTHQQSHAGDDDDAAAAEGKGVGAEHRGGGGQGQRRFRRPVRQTAHIVQHGKRREGVGEHLAAHERHEHSGGHHHQQRQQRKHPPPAPVVPHRRHRRGAALRHAHRLIAAGPVVPDLAHGWPRRAASSRILVL